MNKSKAPIAISKLIGGIQMFWGVWIAFCGGVCTIMFLTDKEFSGEVGSGFVFSCLIMFGIGIMLIMFSRKRKKLVLNFKKYVAAISTNPTGSIEKLAASVGTPPDIVKKDLDLMIKRKFFVNAFINLETNCIIIGNTTNNKSTQQTQQAPQTQPTTQTHQAPQTSRTQQTTTQQTQQRVIMTPEQLRARDQQIAQQVVQQIRAQAATASNETVPVACKCCGGMNKVAKGKIAECDFCGSPING